MPIDLGHLNQYSAGDTALEAEILRLFSETAHEILNDLMATDSHTEWCDLVHKLKGSALAVGAWELAELAARAERIEWNGKARSICLPELKNAVDTATSYAERVRPQDHGV